MFSSRLPWTQTRNRLTELASSCEIVVDLTDANPTGAIDYPAAELAAALADPRLARYQPSARGLPEARAAVAARHGVSPEDVLLTASTSEAYAYLLKLLCDPGDVVLAPEPSYPLFAELVALEGARLRPYRLAYDGDWHIDFSTVDARGARAILVVSPGNPTGAYVSQADLDGLAGLGTPLVLDEVFAPYPFRAAPALRYPESVLCVRLGGLSKGSGLPQLKLGWMLVGGPADVRRAALDRLEHVADSYLSVSTPVMLAADRLLELGDDLQARLRARVRENRAALLAAAGRFEVLAADAGWSAILRYPRLASDEELALRLLESHGVLVHPGYLFDLPLESCLVVSLLPPPDAFRRGLEALTSLEPAPPAR